MKNYNLEFKKQIATEYLKGNKSFTKLSIEFGVSQSTLHAWVKKYSEECQFNESNKSLPSQELRDLRKRNAELEKEILFLKKAAAFFAKEID